MGMTVNQGLVWGMLLYLAAISLYAVYLTAHDKNAARRGAWRVKERTLVTVAVFGGSAAMLLTMLVIRHKTRHRKFMVGLPLLLLLQIAAAGFGFNQKLAVSYYRIDSDRIQGQIKLALVADLHSCDYGDGQKELIAAIDAEKPDVLFLCGDIFDDRLLPGNTVAFLEGVSGRYPCYYVSGNHEFWGGEADRFKDILASFGVVVLEGSADIFEVRGDRILIGGIDDPDVDHFANHSLPYAEQMAKLGDVASQEVFTVLLSHRPERIHEFLPLNADLVLSGHAHGGQWRLPFILENGLLSPNQGLFPQYTNGEYAFGDTELIVSRGLARESIPVPRVFNRPEIVMVVLE